LSVLRHKIRQRLTTNKLNSAFNEVPGTDIFRLKNVIWVR